MTKQMPGLTSAISTVLQIHQNKRFKQSIGTGGNWNGNQICWILHSICRTLPISCLWYVTCSYMNWIQCKKNRNNTMIIKNIKSALATFLNASSILPTIQKYCKLTFFLWKFNGGFSGSFVFSQLIISKSPSKADRTLILCVKKDIPSNHEHQNPCFLFHCIYYADIPAFDLMCFIMSDAMAVCYGHASFVSILIY